MADIEIYTSGFCGYCHRAKAVLDSLEQSYTEIRVDMEPGRRDEMMERSQRRTVPQIFIDGRHLGGCDDLLAAQRSGELDRWLGRP